MDSIPDYQYRPLFKRSSIRILALEPALELPAPLRAKILHEDRDSLLLGTSSIRGFEAVSYTWGHPAFTKILLVDDAKIKITAIVKHMLRRLRKASKMRYLWIDAICLNQEDMTEKEVQVPCMGEIYQSAAKVHVWLGHAFEYHQILQVFAAFRTIATLKGRDVEDPNQIEEFLKMTCGNSYLWCIQNFLLRPWFTRRWILQECVLNQHTIIRCGQYKLPWGWFAKSAEPLRKHLGVELVDSALEALDMVCAISTSSESRVLDLLWHFHASKCSVEADRIFALYGMAKDSTRIPDVVYFTHWRSTFERVAEWYFNADGLGTFEHLVAFGALRWNEQRFKGVVPSWVPDWNCKRISRKPQNALSLGESDSVDSPTASTLSFPDWSWKTPSILDLGPRFEDSDSENPVTFTMTDRSSLIIGRAPFLGLIGTNSEIKTPNLKAKLIWCAKEMDQFGEGGFRMLATLFYPYIRDEEDTKDIEYTQDIMRTDNSKYAKRKLNALNSIRTELKEFTQVPNSSARFDSVLEKYSLFCLRESVHALVLGSHSAEPGDLLFLYPDRCRLQEVAGWGIASIGFILRPWYPLPKNHQIGQTPNPGQCEFIGTCLVVTHRRANRPRLDVEIV